MIGWKSHIAVLGQHKHLVLVRNVPFYQVLRNYVRHHALQLVHVHVFVPLPKDLEGNAQWNDVRLVLEFGAKIRVSRQA
jgi:hypothetical protein